jgi:hypothetical protein
MVGFDDHSVLDVKTSFSHDIMSILFDIYMI